MVMLCKQTLTDLFLNFARKEFRPESILIMEQNRGTMIQSFTGFSNIRAVPQQKYEIIKQPIHMNKHSMCTKEWQTTYEEES
jgi:hypothetical protein